MLQNIYNYSKGDPYNQAVFLVGADHKKSIMRKIIEYERLSEIKLNWTMYAFVGDADTIVDPKTSTDIVPEINNQGGNA